MDYKEKLTEFIKDNSNVGLICDSCIAKRKEKFQNLVTAGLTLKVGDCTKVSLITSILDSDVEYIWVILTRIISQNTFVGTIDSDLLNTEIHSAGDKITFKTEDCIDFISKDWDEETVAKHIFLGLQDTQQSHTDDKHGEN